MAEQAGNDFYFCFHEWQTDHRRTCANIPWIARQVFASGYRKHPNLVVGSSPLISINIKSRYGCQDTWECIFRTENLLHYAPPPDPVRPKPYPPKYGLQEKSTQS